MFTICLGLILGAYNKPTQALSMPIWLERQPKCVQ